MTAIVYPERDPEDAYVRSLRAEIERHQAVRKVVEQENDELRTCNSRQRAEIERLRALLEAKTTPGYELLATTIEKMEADNERMRAALQQIVDRYETAEDGWPAEDMRAIARRALENKP